MERKMLVRYLILMMILAFCAGGVWYLKNHTEKGRENAILARAKQDRPLSKSQPDDSWDPGKLWEVFSCEA